MGDDVVENLILAIEAAGVPEAAAAVDDLTVSVDALAESMDRADVAASGGGAGGKGLMGHLTSMKTLFAGLGIYEAVKQFSSFQSQMEKLRTQTGATQTEVAKMSKGILSMAVSVGTGPSSMAQALYHIESAGYRGQTALDALRISAQGAKIGGAELTATTTGLTAVMVAGFKGVNTLRAAMGQLNATVGAGDMTFEDLNSALGTGLLSTLKTLGLQVKDGGAALAVLGDNNIRGAAAATRLRMGLMTLVKPSEAAEGAMAKLGLQPLQLAETLRKPDGLLKMLELLKSRMHDLSPTQQAATLADIFGGGRNSAAMLTLINQMDRLRSKYEMVDKGGKEFNSDWKATTRTLAFFGDQLKALGEVALIKLGTGIAWVIGKLKDLASAFQHNKVWAVALVAALAGIAAAVVVFQLVTTAVEVATGAWETFNLVLMANPIFLIIAAVVAIGVALYLLVTKVKAVREAFVDAFKWVKTAVGDAVDFIKEHWRLLLPLLIGPIGLAVDFITAHFHAIVDVVKWVVGAAKTVWKALESIFVGPFKLLWTVVKTVAVAIVHAISWAVSQIEHLLSKVLGPLKSVAHFAGGLIGGGAHLLGDVGHFMGLAGGTPQVTQGGAFLVGEQGPEVVYLPRGAAVQPNASVPTSAQSGPGVLEATINNIMDGRIVSKQVLRQSLMEQSCKG